MIKYYFHGGPNPSKVSLFLAESGLPFEVVAVDTLKGEQHTEAFRKVNPNGKLPAIDDDGTFVFDSNAILMYLSEKTGKFAGKTEDRGEMLSWLMFVASGLGPFSGQSVHFRHAAPEQLPYAINRFLHEANRHYQVLEKHLEGKEYIVSDEFTIADISAWGWVDKAQFVLGDEALTNYPNIQRWFTNINTRPAVEQARKIGSELTFKSELDDVAKHALFPQNYTK